MINKRIVKQLFYAALLLSIVDAASTFMCSWTGQGQETGILTAALIPQVGFNTAVILIMLLNISLFAVLTVIGCWGTEGTVRRYAAAASLASASTVKLFAVVSNLLFFFTVVK